MASISLLWIIVAMFVTVCQAANAADRNDAEALNILSRVKRVIGGNDIDVGQWPWLAHLKGKIPSKTFWGIPTEYKVYSCGASVINKRWLLTAAHCFHVPGAPSKIRTPKYWHATIGEVDADHSVVDRFSGFLSRIFGRPKDKVWYIHADQIFLHPSYNTADSWKHDVAVIHLEKDLPIGSDDAISAVRLPAGSSDTSWPTEGEECVMKGWGCTENGGSTSDTAKAVALPAVGENTCNTYYRAVSSTRMCAGQYAKNTGICPGDSGGPLVCKVNGNWVQAGIASYTSKNQPGQIPAVFTRVSYYADWIKAKVGSITQ